MDADREEDYRDCEREEDGKVQAAVRKYKRQFIVFCEKMPRSPVKVWSFHGRACYGILPV